MGTPMLAMGAALGFIAGVGGRAVTDEQGKASNLYILLVAPSSSGKDQAFTGVNLLSRARVRRRRSWPDGASQRSAERTSKGFAVANCAKERPPRNTRPIGRERRSLGRERVRG